MSKFLNVLLEKREPEKVEQKFVKPKYDWRYENNIIKSKKKIELDGDYSQWRTNSSLANHYDLVKVANIMSINHHITNQMHYDFLFNYVRKTNRWFPPETKEQKKKREAEQELISLVSNYYKYNDVRSREVLKVLSDEQIAIIRSKNNKGGAK